MHFVSELEGESSYFVLCPQAVSQTRIELDSHVPVSQSVQSLDRLGRRGGHEGRFSRDPLPVFSAGSHCEQLWHGQGCPLFDVVHPAFWQFLCRPRRRPPGALKNGFGEAVVACDMPEPCKFPSLDSCQNRFPWTHKEVDLAPLPVIGVSIPETNRH